MISLNGPLATLKVDNDPDLWKVRDWAASDTVAKVRVIQTCVNAYGALDQRSGTTYFDVGDTLVKVLGQILVLSQDQVTRYTEEA